MTSPPRPRTEPPTVVVWAIALVDLVARTTSRLHAEAKRTWPKGWPLVRDFVARTAQQTAGEARARAGRFDTGKAAKVASTIAGAALIASTAAVIATPATRTAVDAFANVVNAAPQQIDVPKLAERSVVYHADGSIVTVLDNGENRNSIELKSISPVLVTAVVDTEDEDFWRHDGVDLQAMLRAARRNVREQAIAEGGSTITQQLVKNTLLTNERSVGRKVEEAVLARQLEKQIGKEEILERYLNTVYFGNRAYGIQAAAETYFGKSASQLTPGQAALLAGVISGPSRFDPIKHAEAAATRRRTVLARMVANGHITAEQAAQAEAEPLPTQVHPPPRHRDHVTDAVIRELLADERLGPTESVRNAAIASGGLHITTTVDPGLQRLAEEAVRGGVPAGYDLTAALASVDPSTGAVKALVGGNYAASQFDAASTGGRQPGSSFKTFALVAALQQGIGPNTEVDGAQPCPIANPGGTPNPWKPENYEGASYGRITLTEATASSVNCAYARLAEQIGPANIAKVAADMGVRAKLSSVPSIVLGTNVVTPLDMAAAYATLAADGIARRPHLVAEVRKANGELLFANSDAGRRVLSEQVARNATAVLGEVVTKGTGTAAALPEHPVAGKTGTAQNYQDAWFAGYTAHLSTAVWLGNLNGEIPMRNVEGRDVTGGSYPARIWHAFMAPAMQGRPPTAFLTADPIGPAGPLTPPPAPAPAGKADGSKDDRKGKRGRD